MLKTIPTFLLVVMILIAIPACNLPSNAPATPTLQVGIPVTGNDSPTPYPNPTVTMGTPLTVTAVVLKVQHTITPVTPSATLNVTSTFAVTPGVVQVRVNAPTYCRAGPSLAYEQVRTMMVEDVAEVIGRNERGNYWLIRNADIAAGTCWIWGRYATLIGDTSVLPVLTPPPVSKVGFDISYHGLENCAGTWWVDLDVMNIGRILFKSISITVRDTDTGITLNQYTNGFGDKNGCSGFLARDELPPEESFVVSAPVFTYNLAGHNLRVTINMCSEVALSGTCVTKIANLTP